MSNLSSTIRTIIFNYYNLHFYTTVLLANGVLCFWCLLEQVDYYGEVLALVVNWQDYWVCWAAHLIYKCYYYMIWYGYGCNLIVNNIIQIVTQGWTTSASCHSSSSSSCLPCCWLSATLLTLASYDRWPSLKPNKSWSSIILGFVLPMLNTFVIFFHGFYYF